MRRAFGLALAIAASISPSRADEALVLWKATDGSTVLTTEIKLPRKITKEHLNSMRFSSTTTLQSNDAGTALMVTVPKKELLSAEVLNNVQLLQSPLRDGAVEVAAEADWSGGEVTMTLALVGACGLTDGYFGGLLRGGESFYVSVTGAMTLVAAAESLKGDPDLYLLDELGNYVCASENVGKTADSCSAIQLSCLNGNAYVEVYGVKKKNSFSLGVWITSAL